MRVARAAAEQAAGLPIAATALAANGAAIVARTVEDAIAISNRIAPEHLVVDRESIARRALTAGAVFVGPFAGQRATTRWLQPVLPTSGPPASAAA